MGDLSFFCIRDRAVYTYISISPVACCYGYKVSEKYERKEKTPAAEHRYSCFIRCSAGRCLLALLSCGAFSGCSDFLEEQSQDKYYISSYADLDELLIAHKKYLPQFADTIARLEKEGITIKDDVARELTEQGL